jgi:DNA-binding NarL/FixJ family response regulator
MSAESIKVMVLDDHHLFIEGLKSLLYDEPGVTFVGGVSNLNEALDFLQKTPVDVILADVNIPWTSGIEITKQIKQLFPELQVLALSMHEDHHTIKQMIEAGAAGYILKRSNMNEVVEAIQVVFEKGTYFGRDVQSILLDSMKGVSHSSGQISEEKVQLTARESEILELIAKEYTNEQIADKLFISERTVETHRRNIFTKTKTKSIVGLIKYAIRHGIVNQDYNNKPNR